jgi:hypothetical protein
LGGFQFIDIGTIRTYIGTDVGLCVAYDSPKGCAMPECAFLSSRSACCIVAALYLQPSSAAFFPIRAFPGCGEAYKDFPMDTIIPAQQYQAALRFAIHHGKNWKHKLRSLWLDGNARRYAVSFDDAAYLQQLRNQQGPDWLRRVRLEDLFIACGAKEFLVYDVASAESVDSSGWMAKAFDLGLRVTTSANLPFADRKHIARDKSGVHVQIRQGFACSRTFNTLGFNEDQLKIVAVLQQTGLLSLKAKKGG